MQAFFKDSLKIRTTVWNGGSDWGRENIKKGNQKNEFSTFNVLIVSHAVCAETETL
jgi:hypothetical protein